MGASRLGDQLQPVYDHRRLVAVLFSLLALTWRLRAGEGCPMG